MENSKSTIRLISAALLFLAPMLQAANVCDPTVGTQCVKVDANGNSIVAFGESKKDTYRFAGTALTAATAHTVSIEAPAALRVRINEICIGTSNATAASSIVVIVQRRSTASSAGTAFTNENTASPVVSKMDPTSGSFGGVVRLDGTPGTAGAILDSYNIQVGIIATGAGSSTPICFGYGEYGNKALTIAAGVTNGISITVPSLGAGSLATSISGSFVVEN